MLAEAVRRKLIEENPFQHLRSGPTASNYTRYVTPKEIEKVIAACPDSEWRLWFGLASYTGLRIPSESHLLTWGDADWDKARLTVRNPRTEHHASREQRVVPIAPELMTLLMDRFSDSKEGETHLVTMRGSWHLTKTQRAACKRAGVEPWKRLWQTPGQSCEKEWAMHFPQYAVSKWIGHSITVSGRHYANDVPDELFELAASPPDNDRRKARQNAQQKPSETRGNEGKTETAADSADNRFSDDCRGVPLVSGNSVSGGGGNRTAWDHRVNGLYAFLSPYRHSIGDTSGQYGTPADIKGQQIHPDSAPMRCVHSMKRSAREYVTCR